MPRKPRFSSQRDKDQETESLAAHDPINVPPPPAADDLQFELRDVLPGSLPLPGFGAGQIQMLDLQAPMPRVSNGGVPEEQAMAAWLRGQYLGHPKALAALVEDVVVSTQPDVAGVEAEAASLERQQRRDLSARYGTLYSFDNSIQEWVFFSTKDYSLLGGSKPRGPGWCCRYRGLLCYRFW